MLNRRAAAPSAGQEGLLVQYFGVYAPEPALPLLTGEPGLTAEPVSYKIVRQSTVSAALVGPDGAQHVLESGAAHAPGTYAFSAGTFDREGTWQWDISATDDLGRTSTVERTFRFDTTLRALAVPRSARQAVASASRSRPAQVTLRIETRSGAVVRALPGVALQPGARSLLWDGRLPRGHSRSRHIRRAPLF